MNKRADTPVKATETSMRILDALLELGTAPLTEITREVELSKSSVHNHLTTLEQLGLVVKSDLTYRVSLRFVEIGARVRETVPFYEVGRQEVERLSNASGLVTGLAVFERNNAVCLHRTTGQQSPEIRLEDGDRLPLHASAPGKAILSELPDEALDSQLAALELQPLTPETVTSEGELRDELARVRTRGVAPDREEWRTEILGLAAGFADPDQTAVGSIFVLSDAAQMSGKQFQQDIPGLLISAANKIRKEL